MGSGSAPSAKVDPVLGVAKPTKPILNPRRSIFIMYDVAKIVVQCLGLLSSIGFFKFHKNASAKAYA